MPTWDVDQRNNVAFYKYDIATGTQEYVDTFIDALIAAKNYEDGESVPEGHTPIVFANGKVYAGSQGIHNFKTLESYVNNLPLLCGSHIFPSTSKRVLLRMRVNTFLVEWQRFTMASSLYCILSGGDT